MLINEIAKKCNTTKKAVQYYVEQGLIVPNVLENGYKDFSEQDTKLLKQIVLYRKLGLSISEIKRVLENHNEVRGILYQRVLKLEQEKVKQEFLKKLASGERVENLEQEINSIGSNTIIIKKLVELFPGYYGKFISLNFSRYLTGKIETEEQMKAFNQIIEFFDNVPDIDLPSDLQKYLDNYLEEYSSEEGIEKINDIIQEKDNAIQNIDEFVKSNKDILDEYMKYKQTDEYMNSPAYRLMQNMGCLYATVCLDQYSVCGFNLCFDDVGNKWKILEQSGNGCYFIVYGLLCCIDCLALKECGKNQADPFETFRQE